MLVVFSIKYPENNVVGLYWEQNQETMERNLLMDGTVKDRCIGEVSDRDLSWVVKRLSGSYLGMRPTEVKSLASASKYLGKNADLIELLPEVRLGDGEDNT